MDKKRVMVEEWKARRKEWKKKRWKKGKGKKWFWEKSFLFLFDCVFASSLFSHAPTTPPHHNSHSHLPTTNCTTRHIGAHHHMQTGLCAVLPFFGSGQQDTLHHPHPTLHLFLFTIKNVGFCQWTSWKCVNHAVSKERGGDYCAMASCQGVLSEG